jgi:hypothetical protein
MVMPVWAVVSTWPPERTRAGCVYAVAKYYIIGTAGTD